MKSEIKGDLDDIGRTNFIGEHKLIASPQKISKSQQFRTFLSNCYLIK